MTAALLVSTNLAWNESVSEELEADLVTSEVVEGPGSKTTTCPYPNGRNFGFAHDGSAVEEAWPCTLGALGQRTTVKKPTTSQGRAQHAVDGSPAANSRNGGATLK